MISLQTARSVSWRGAGWIVALGAVATTAWAAAVPARMQAYRTDSATPGVLKLETVDTPVPTENQVLIQVYAAGANPSDWRTGGGGPPGGGAPGGGGPGGGGPGAGGPPGGGGGPPGGMRMGARNPGNDVTGVIVAVGSGITDFKVGDAVVAALQQAGGGAYAEYAIARDQDLARKPNSFTYEQAAGIPTAGFTGLRMAKLANIQKGERVAIVGAAGGVGSTALQVAKLQGAHVIAIASSKHNAYLKKLGADEIVDYDTDKVADKVKDVDVTIVTVGSENAAGVSYTRRGGRVVTIVGQADAAACTAAGVTCINGGPGAISDGDLVRELVSMANAGKFTVDVEKVFPFAQLNDALAMGRTGNREGKIVISMNKDSSKR